MTALRPFQSRVAQARGPVLKFAHILVVVSRGVPAGHAENSPAIHGWVDRRRLTRVPEGGMNDSIVPPGLKMQRDSLSQR